MEDLSRKIGELLSDPSTLEQIKGLTGLLGQSDFNNQKTVDTSCPVPSQPKNDFMNPELLGTVMKIAPLLQSINKDDDSTRLLRALKPFMSEEKCKKIDEAIKMLGLFKMLPLMKSVGVSLF